MLIQNHQLTNKQIDDLNQLMHYCKLVDTNCIPVYTHLLSQKRPIPCNFLLYDEESSTMVGFCSLYLFYDNGCECAIMVAPQFRKQGNATRLLRHCLPLIEQMQLQNVIFSAAEHTFAKALYHQPFLFLKSEYEMHRRTPEGVSVPLNDIVFQQATLSDLVAIQSIDTACFPEQQSGFVARLRLLLQDPKYTIIVAKHYDEVIGKAHICWQKPVVKLSDIAVLPAWQKKGVGRALIAHCIQHCHTKHYLQIGLNVETRNTHALQLYLRLGFEVLNACEYWQISVANLSKLLDGFTTHH